MHEHLNKTLVFFILFFAGFHVSEAQVKSDSRPNIILIVADDLGYTDLGCYGGEIKTPNIDLLAKQGIQFTHFYTAPLCAPTRSMILSGNDNHVAGMGSMFSVMGTSREGKTGYEHHLTDRIVSVAQVLMMEDTRHLWQANGIWAGEMLLFHMPKALTEVLH